MQKDLIARDRMVITNANSSALECAGPNQMIREDNSTYCAMTHEETSNRKTIAQCIKSRFLNKLAYSMWQKGDIGLLSSEINKYANNFDGCVLGRIKGVPSIECNLAFSLRAVSSILPFATCNANSIHKTGDAFLFIVLLEMCLP